MTTLKIPFKLKFTYDRALLWTNYLVIALGLAALVYCTLYLKTMVYDTLVYVPSSIVWSNGEELADINLIKFNSVSNVLKNKTVKLPPPPERNPFQKMIK